MYENPPMVIPCIESAILELLRVAKLEKKYGDLFNGTYTSKEMTKVSENISEARSKAVEYLHDNGFSYQFIDELEEFAKN